MNGRQGGGERVHRTPVLGGQEREADFSRGEGDVWMGDSRGEVDLGWA